VTNKEFTKTAYAESLGVSRASLYYQQKQPEKDWHTKQMIEGALREFPSYGHKRLADHLRINKKRVRRVMKLYGIKPYRRRGKKWKKPKRNDVSFPNLLLEITPQYPNHIWASDFTYLPFKGRFVYVATLLDIYTRRIVGVNVLTTHSAQFVMNALGNAVLTHHPPAILHSDHGSEYASKDYVEMCTSLGVIQSMSAKGCPWENGYQESFYNQFKVDLGDPGRFERLGELVSAIYQTIHTYNNTRIHTILGIPPASFAEGHQRSNALVELVS